MPDKTDSSSSFPHKYHLAAILFSYAILASIFGYAYRFAMNPDGLSLVRLAGYIAEGNFQQSIVPGWSPLTIWIISPFIFFGFDGLTAARISIALCGVAMLLCSWFLASRFDLSQNFRFIALLIAALLISVWTVQFIAADVLIAALILCYIYLVTDPNILNNRRISFLCGIVGGFSYLAHHYAFPFFIVHFPSLLLLRGYVDKDKKGVSLKNILISWMFGVAGFIIIASVWVSIASAKYGHLIISSKGPVAYSSVGPPDVDRRAPHFYGGLNKPKKEYMIHVFEDPSGLKFKTWSPFESKKYFIHQLKLIKENLIHILNHFVKQSPFFTYAFVIGVFALIPVSLLLNQLNNKKRFLYLWVIITFSLFSSGYILIIARSPRRFYALMVVFLLLSFHFMEELKTSFSNIISGRRKKLSTYYLLLITVAAFTLKPGILLSKSLKNIITSDQVNPYREIAEQINTVEFPVPYAIMRSSQKPTTDYYITYFLRKQLLGRPLSADVDGITKELKAADAKSLVVFDNQEIAEKLMNDDRYIHIAAIKLKNDKRYEYAVNIVFQDHEIITGWDKRVNIFKIRQPR